MLSINELPALRFLIPFVFGMLFAYNNTQSGNDVGFTLWIWIGIGGVVLAWGMKRGYAYRWRIIPSVALLLISFVAGYLMFLIHIPGQEQSHIRHHPGVKEAREIIVSGICAQAPVSRHTTQLVLDILWTKEADEQIWTETSGSIILFSKNLNELCVPRPGDRVMVNVRLTPPTPSINPHAFDYGKYLWTQGILYTGFVDAGDIMVEKPAPWYNLYTLTYNMRNVMMKRTYDLMGYNEQADLTCGLLFGYRDKIDPETEEMFVNTGAVHLLAVSGMHVILIYANIRWLFRFLRLDRMIGAQTTSLLAIVCIWIFSFVVGLAASIVRASLMLTLLIVGELLKRHTNSMNLVSAGAVMILIFNPLTLFDVGFQLSFAAVLGIIHLQKPVKNALPAWLQRVPMVTDLVAVTIAAQVTTLPLILFYFHQFPTYFVLTGIFAVFISDYVIKLGGILLLVSVFSMDIAQWFGLLWYWTAHALLLSVDLVNRLPGGLIDLVYFDGWMMVVLTCIIGLWMIRQYRPIRRFYLSVGLLMLVLMLFDFVSIHRNSNTAAITFYAHSKIRVVEIRNGLNSLIIADSTFVDKNFKDIARPNLIAHAVKQYDILRLSESQSASFRFGGEHVSLPAANLPIDSAQAAWVFVRPNERIKHDCNNRFIQYQYKTSRTPCDEKLVNLKVGCKILDVTTAAFD